MLRRSAHRLSTVSQHMQGVEAMEATMTNVGRLIDLISFRRDRFCLVADVFACESSKETVTQMIAQASSFNSELDDGSIEAALNRVLASLANDDMATFARKTRTEYARLFLGPRTVVAPLHESAYLSGTPRMFTSDTLAVRAFLERHGYVMKAKNLEPEDSVGVEFEFLRNICDRCISLLEIEGGDAAGEVGRLLEAQEAFEEQHMGRWLPEFAERVVDGDQSGFYAAWATYLIGVLGEDDALLRECKSLLVEMGRLVEMA